MNLLLRLAWILLTHRRRSPIGIWDEAVTPMRVAPTDLDPLLHMNNGKYLSLMDLGRVDLMLRAGLWPRLNKLGWYPVVAAQTITYRRSLNPLQGFDLVTRVIGFDDRAVYVEQTFRRDGRIHANAIVKARFLKKSGGSVSIEELLSLTGPAPADLTLPDWVEEWSTRTRIRESAQ